MKERQSASGIAESLSPLEQAIQDYLLKTGVDDDLKKEAKRKEMAITFLKQNSMKPGATTASETGPKARRPSLNSSLSSEYLEADTTEIQQALANILEQDKERLKALQAAVDKAQETARIQEESAKKQEITLNALTVAVHTLTEVLKNQIAQFHFYLKASKNITNILFVIYISEIFFNGWGCSLKVTPNS